MQFLTEGALPAALSAFGSGAADTYSGLKGTVAHGLSLGNIISPETYRTYMNNLQSEQAARNALQSNLFPNNPVATGVGHFIGGAAPLAPIGAARFAGPLLGQALKYGLLGGATGAAATSPLEEGQGLQHGLKMGLLSAAFPVVGRQLGALADSAAPTIEQWLSKIPGLRIRLPSDPMTTPLQPSPKLTELPSTPVAAPAPSITPGASGPLKIPVEAYPGQIAGDRQLAQSLDSIYKNFPELSDADAFMQAKQAVANLGPPPSGPLPIRPDNSAGLLNALNNKWANPAFGPEETQYLSRAIKGKGPAAMGRNAPEQAQLRGDYNQAMAMQIQNMLQNGNFSRLGLGT